MLVKARKLASILTDWLVLALQQLYLFDRRLERVAMGMDRGFLWVLLVVGVVLVILVGLFGDPQR